MKSPEPPKPKSLPRQLAAFQVVFLVMFLVFGVGMVRDGREAIRNQVYNLKFSQGTSSSRTQTPGRGIHMHDSAVEYTGRDATVIGVGLEATGGLLLAWAIGLALSLVGHMGIPMPLFITRAVAAVAMSGLTVGCIGLFPPWHLHTFPLYLVVTVLALTVTLPIPDPIRKKVIPGILVVFMIVGTSAVPWMPAVPLFAGIIVFLIGIGNVAFLCPGLIDQLLKSDSKKAPDR